MEHSQPCESLIDLKVAHARTEERQADDHNWIESIDRDHETTKSNLQEARTDIARIKERIALIVAVATVAGNVLFKLVEVIIPTAHRGIVSEISADTTRTR